MTPDDPLMTQTIVKKGSLVPLTPHASFRYNSITRFSRSLKFPYLWNWKFFLLNSRTSWHLAIS